MRTQVDSVSGGVRSLADSLHARMIANTATHIVLRGDADVFKVLKGREELCHQRRTFW